MTCFDIQTLESDLHRLDLRFASLRMQQPRLVDRLARSIEQNGQLVPVVAVTGPANQWGADRWLSAHPSPAPPVTGYRLVRAQGRTWEAIEEGAIIQELTTRFELSQREVARQTGRDASWVNRRLSLVEGLPDPLFGSVQDTCLCRARHKHVS